MGAWILAIPGVKRALAIGGAVIAAIVGLWIFVKTQTRAAVKQDRQQSKIDALEEKEKIREREDEIDSEPKKGKDEILSDLLGDNTNK